MSAWNLFESFKKRMAQTSPSSADKREAPTVVTPPAKRAVNTLPQQQEQQQPPQPQENSPEEIEAVVNELIKDILTALEFSPIREFRGLNDLSYPTDKPSELDSSEEFVDASDLVDPGVSESLLTEISTNPAVSSAAVETVLASDNSQILPNCSPSVEEKSKSDTFADATDINCNRVLSSDLQAKSNGNHSPTPDLSDIQNQTVAQELLVSILAEIDSREQLVSEPEEQQKLLESPPTTTCEHSKIQSTPGCEKDFSPEANNTKVEPKMNETVVTGGGDTPIAAKGEYKIDWDNLEQYDPFGGKSPGAKVTPKKKVPSTPLSDGNANSSDVVNINENDSNSNIMTSPATFVSPSKTVDDNYTSELKGSQNDNQFGLTNGDQPSPSKSSPALQPKSPKVSAVVAPMVMANQLADTFDSLPAKNVTSRSSPRPVSKTPDKFESKLIPTSPQKLDASGEEFMMASSDMFGDPEAMDFLSRAGGANSNGFVETELHKQSLYVRFDPLVQPTATNLSPAKVETMVGSMDETIMDSEAENFGDDLLSMKTPPTSESRPKVNSSVTVAVDTTPPATVKKRLNSTPKTSPRVGGKSEVDKLLSVTPSKDNSGEFESLSESANASILGNEKSEIVDGDALMALKLQLQAELAAKESEWKARLDAETKKSAELRKDVDHLKRQLADCTHFGILYMKSVHQTSGKSGDKSKSKTPAVGSANLDAVVKQKEQALEDLEGLEASFSDLHRRYEKLKTITDENKKNEEKLKLQLIESQEKCRKAEDRFRRLKEHAETRLEKANEEVENLQKLRETDTLGLKATLKKKEITIESLENQLDQSKKEVSELTSICDELIAKHSNG